jgi:hypothetical protein
MTTLSAAASMGVPRISFTATWMITALLPLPVLLTVSPADSADVSCLYLGLASAWLAIHVFAADGTGLWRAQLSVKLSRLYLALAVNLAIFIFLGLSVNVESQFPFARKAALSVVPAMGLVPWLTLRMRNPLSVIILAAVIELSEKLAGCVVARFVYGPNFQLEGRIAGDWTTAKVMISTFWILSSSASVVALSLIFSNHSYTKSQASGGIQ